MSSLRKLTRKETAPQKKEAKKKTEKYQNREMIARSAVLTQENTINKQGCTTVNICAFIVLKDIFKFSSKKISFLSHNMNFQVSCLEDKLITLKEINQAIKDETKWTFPKRKKENLKERTKMTAVEMANQDVQMFLDEVSNKMELLWLWVLRLREGFSKVRMERFINELRNTEKTLTNEKATEIKNWLSENGVNIIGFETEINNKVKIWEDKN